MSHVTNRREERTGSAGSDEVVATAAPDRSLLGGHFANRSVKSQEELRG
jgi:hypothetical protein